jgi:hypothetical protein
VRYAARNQAGDHRRGSVFVGAWQVFTLCIWGKSIEILLDPYSLPDANELQIKASLVCDVAAPESFGVEVAALISDSRSH